MNSDFWEFIGRTLASGVVTAAILALVGLAARTWISEKIKESVAAGYKREHERFTAELRWNEARRARSAQMADVVADWIALEHDPNKQHSVAAFLAFQRSYWTLALWLDAPTLRSLNAALTRQDGAHYKQAIVAARSLLVGEEAEPVRAEEIVHFALPSQTSLPTSSP